MCARGKKNPQRMKTSGTDWKNLDAPRPEPQSKTHQSVTLSLKYCTTSGKCCFKDCDAQELKGVLDCFRKLTSMSWQDVLKQGGKRGNKTGLAYTLYEDSALKGVKRPPSIDSEFRISSLRVSDKFRIFGVYAEHVYHPIWFDRNHEICPS